MCPSISMAIANHHDYGSLKVKLSTFLDHVSHKFAFSDAIYLARIFFISCKRVSNMRRVQSHQCEGWKRAIASNNRRKKKINNETNFQNQTENLHLVYTILQTASVAKPTRIYAGWHPIDGSRRIHRNLLMWKRNCFSISNFFFELVFIGVQHLSVSRYTFYSIHIWLELIIPVCWNFEKFFNEQQCSIQVFFFLF